MADIPETGENKTALQTNTNAASQMNADQLIENGQTLFNSSSGWYGMMYGAAMMSKGQQIRDAQNAELNARKVPGEGLDSALNAWEIDSDEKIELKAEKVNEHDLLFRVPNWGYDNFIYERQSWLKGLDSITGDPGLFYFKIFFQFDTPNGLFGGILPMQSGDQNIVKDQAEGDCASRYLRINVPHYTKEPMEDRWIALQKFTSSLSFISSRAPWFFDSVSGLDKAINASLTKPMEDKYIEINCREDAVDMRLATLMDLYRYSAYDYVNLKEVLPQNLRQFEMIICLFHTPLRWYDTATQTYKGRTYQYRRMNGAMENRMSYKMITLKGCEFDVDSIGDMVPSTISNERGFTLGKSKIKIHFRRSYCHTFNEWGGFLIGDDGVYYNKFDGDSRLEQIAQATTVPFYRNYGADTWKPLVDATEKYVTGAVGKVNTRFVFGNLYNDLTDLDGDYYRDKLYALKHGADWLH